MAISCRVTRGDMTESIHVAFAVAVDQTGQPFFSSGDPHYLTCIRSSLKPFQAAASVKLGAVDEAGFNEKELALMCASHKGEPMHVETAESMLSKLGLNKDYYECGSHYPSDKNTRHQMIARNEGPNPLHNNCSGKHAGMLALGRRIGVDIDGYVEQDHPVQKKIMEYVKDLIGLDDIPIQRDGCSAPTPFMSLQTIAIMYQKLAECKYDELSRIFNAMSSYPEMIGGSNHFDSLFIEALNGRAITKIGGESIRGFAIKSDRHGPIGIALKILDGNFRAMPVASMKMLGHLELLTKEEMKKLDHFSVKKLINHNGIEIGKIEAYVDF